MKNTLTNLKQNSLCLHADESLVALSKDGATNAYEVLVQRHSASLYWFLLRLCGNSAIAEELAQEAFFRAWLRLRSFVGNSSFKSWLFSIANNIFIDFARQEKSRKMREKDWANDEARFSNPPNSGANHILEQLLRHFSNEHRAVLQLFYGEEFTQNEIADIVKMPLGSVKSIITRAKGKMQSLLSAEIAEVMNYETK